MIRQGEFVASVLAEKNEGVREISGVDKGCRGGQIPPH